MCAIVHGYAGMGRTGTVIYAFLCYDHYQQLQQVDFIDILNQLRIDRPNLVETADQFKLSLEILDEMLFGSKYLITVSTAQKQLGSLKRSCRKMYEEIEKLPQSLTYNTAIMKFDLNLNRNRMILPGDDRMVVLEVKRIIVIYITPKSKIVKLLC